MIFKRILLILFTVAVGSMAAESQKLLIDHDTTLTQSLFVPPNATLTILPGVVISLDGYLTICVEGGLIALATADKPILITGLNRPRGSTDRPSWQGVEIKGKGSDVHLRHVWIEGAFRNLIYQSSPVVDSCTFAGNYTGLFCAGQATPTLSSNKMYDNIYGVVIEMSAPLLVGNQITGNRIGLQLPLGSKIGVGNNAMTANGEDLRYGDNLGMARDTMGIKKVWDLMNQLY